MDKHSYTSSSKTTARRPSVPWAFLMALAILACVEIATRLAPPTKVIPYRFLLEEYRAVSSYLDVVGPAEISFVGSSRTRDGINLPVLRQIMQQRMGKSATLANYACSGATAKEVLAIIEEMHRNDPPRMIVYGVSPFQIHGGATSFYRVAEMWTLAEFISELDIYGRQLATAGVLSTVLRNEIGKWYRTLRYRNIASQTFGALLDTPVLSCPIKGEITAVHHDNPDRSLVTFPVNKATVQKDIRTYFPEGESAISQINIECLDRLLAKCQEAGTQIILFELPLPAIYNRNFPPEAMQKFRQSISQLTDRYDFTWVSTASLEVEFGDHDFFDASHLSAEGARRFTQALAEKVILPQWQARMNDDIDTTVASKLD